MDGFLFSFASGGLGPMAAILWVAWKLDRRLLIIETWIGNHDKAEAHDR